MSAFKAGDKVRPEWVRILSRIETSCAVKTGAVVKVVSWDGRGPRVRCDHGEFTPGKWEPAEEPEQTVMVELPRDFAERWAGDMGKRRLPGLAAACAAALEADQ